MLRSGTLLPGHCSCNLHILLHNSTTTRSPLRVPTYLTYHRPSLSFTTSHLPPVIRLFRPPPPLFVFPIHPSSRSPPGVSHLLSPLSRSLSLFYLVSVSSLLSFFSRFPSFSPRADHDPSLKSRASAQLPACVVKRLTFFTTLLFLAANPTILSTPRRDPVHVCVSLAEVWFFLSFSTNASGCLTSSPLYTKTLAHPPGSPNRIV